MAKAQQYDLTHELFLALVRDAGLPEPRHKTHPDGELLFAKDSGIESIGSRAWRWDYSWDDSWPDIATGLKLAIERDGGIWRGGRGGGKGRGGHSGGAGQLNDMAKQNAGCLLGWRLLRYTPEQMASGLPIRQIQELLRAEAARQS